MNNHELTTYICNRIDNATRKFTNDINKKLSKLRDVLHEELKSIKLPKGFEVVQSISFTDRISNRYVITNPIVVQFGLNHKKGTIEDLNRLIDDTVNTFKTERLIAFDKQVRDLKLTIRRIKRFKKVHNV